MASRREVVQQGLVFQPFSFFRTYYRTIYRTLQVRLGDV